MENKNTDSSKWLKLMVLILGGGTVFKLPFLKDAFYVPMQEQFHLSHIQIGTMLSVYAIVQTFGYILSIYITDRFSKKKLLPVGLIGVGVLGFFMLTSPGYGAMLILWALFALFAELLFWPVLIKAVRLLGGKEEQGRMFGFLEAGRGVVDTVVAFSALAIFNVLGEGTTGLKGAIVFYAAIVIIVGIASYFMLEDDIIVDTDKNGNKINKSKAAMQGALRAIKMPEIWLVSFTIFSVYTVYCGLTYFIPFLKDIYGLPVTLVGAYGIINQYGLKMLGGPIGGFLADKKFKSSAKYIRFAFILSIVAMAIFIYLPHETMNVYLGMFCTLGFGAIVFTQRAVFFAPMEEVEIPREIAGAAASVACFIGYAPSMFAFTMYGGMLDRTPGIAGYRYVFMTMIAFAVLGLIVSSVLCKVIKQKKELAK
ncbi:MFS transporter [Clostridium gasigenes]|uniref:MFS transporter n=1 Tax=Clostridium gasigenes TaxID=94869 RepID=UPI001C0CAAFA|nr:MFS transporter [Clostridium gasigenes]MBU3136193.1 MFS transporter [Clostridium gasigenes]